jgi:hypothetical protein
VKYVLAVTMCLACAGCAAQKAAYTEPAPEPEPAARITLLEKNIQQIEAQLEQDLQAAARPECPRVCELGGNICKLAQKICDIASRNPQHENLKDRCKDARLRCQTAHQKVSEHCECSALDF